MLRKHESKWKWPWYRYGMANGHGMAMVGLWYGYDLAVVWLWFGYGLAMVGLWYGYDVFLTLSVKLIFLLIYRNFSGLATLKICTNNRNIARHYTK